MYKKAAIRLLSQGHGKRCLDKNSPFSIFCLIVLMLTYRSFGKAQYGKFCLTFSIRVVVHYIATAFRKFSVSNYMQKQFAYAHKPLLLLYLVGN